MADAHLGKLWNLRDLGGHRAAAGRTVRWRRLYRSSSLHVLGEAERAPFCELGIRTVLDLRRAAEIAHSGRSPEWAQVSWRHLPFRHRDWAETPYDRTTDLVEYLVTRYGDMATLGAADVVEALRVISEVENAPVLVHCVAGKDRTGIVCAMALSLLGVADEAVAAEYALTSAALRRMIVEWTREAQRAGEAVPELPLDTPAEAMLQFLQVLRARHGSVEGYLREAGLTEDAIAALRAHLLE